MVSQCTSRIRNDICNKDKISQYYTVSFSKHVPPYHNVVGLKRVQTKDIGAVGSREVVHLVVEDQSSAGREDHRAEVVVDCGRDAHRIAPLVDDGQMRRSVIFR
jgi:hypothetical protein